MKAEEVEWSGINEFLEGRKRFPRRNCWTLKGIKVEVKEVVKGDH